MLILVVSVSRHLVIGAKDAVRYQEKDLDVSLAHALAGTARRCALVHYVLWESKSRAIYTEVGCPGDMPALEDFLARAIDPATGSFTAHDLTAGIGVANTLLKTMRQIPAIFHRFGASVLQPSQEDTKRSPTLIKTMERDRYHTLAFKKASLYRVWKIVAPKLSRGETEIYKGCRRFTSPADIYADFMAGK